MRYKILKQLLEAPCKPRSKIQPPPPAIAEPIIRVSNNVAHLGRPPEGPKPRQMLSLPPFPGHPLPGRKSSTTNEHVTAISWLKYYFDEIPPPVIQNHFNKGLVQTGIPDSRDSLGCYSGRTKSLMKINHSDIMEVGARVHVPVSVAESKISKRFDVIPSGTPYPNADEINYVQRLVEYKDSAILVLNKPPKFPLKGRRAEYMKQGNEEEYVKQGSITEYMKQGSRALDNSMDALAAAALSYDYEEGPKLVHRLDRESSGLLLMGRTKESISHLQSFLGKLEKAKFLSKEWDDACKAAYKRYWALVIGSPTQKEGLIQAPLSEVLLSDGNKRVILAHNSGLEASQEAITEYRVLGPTINGCSWIELRPHTSCKHQLRVHCAEALGTPIVGDFWYGWFVHSRWKQMPQIDFEPTTGQPYRMRPPLGLQVQKGSVLAKVPLLHLHCREMVLPNIAKFIEYHKRNMWSHKADSKPDILRFVAEMPSHMKISWNLMSSYLH